MKARTKTVAVLLVTLLIGIAIGALSWSTVHDRRVERMREVRNERGRLYSMVESQLAPLTPEQEPEVRRIVEEFRQRMGQIYRNAVRQHSGLMDSMAVELDSVLTDEQREKFRTWIDESRRTALERGRRRDGDRD